ncbi:hypothetical protein BABINDRAFT_160982 [Babjeviella inositovora NRRL Y-12698]|uniref:Uncharacterized protein n=1 Tax=Babjeviella inositovora NRRL Y-12698 TaxID=984486 RepID=A0A1E3QT00_9ASCO|nr:uncharacterized protein BABINDRAFT_160982 [Babjeviella inositovora NRRL Y-12698]ODQ80768.1 hypothetical protein BABINDRAFT_160982 [Babjeviella inositovora NRRL Y-12698]
MREKDVPTWHKHFVQECTPITATVSLLMYDGELLGLYKYARNPPDFNPLSVTSHASLLHPQERQSPLYTHTMVARNAQIGFAIGLLVPVLATKFYIKPKLIKNDINDIELLKHDLEYATWHLRLLQRNAGVADADLYYPNGRFKALVQG